MSTAAEYRDFLIASGRPWCWACGRSSVERPRDWGGPFLIERAHIVSNPRVEDRRAVVALCSICHKLAHGIAIESPDVVAPSLGEILWLKKTFDPDYYDRPWLADHAIGRLPAARRPRHGIEAVYFFRRGNYPNE